MDKDAITLDILRKEYEIVSKSIDDQSKYVSSLFTFSLALLTVLATTIIGLYKNKTDSFEGVSILIKQNIDLLYIFLFVSALFLLIFRFINLQTIVQNVIYKEHLEKQINYLLNRNVLIWNHKVLKNVGLAPYQLTFIGHYINAGSWLLIFFCMWLIYTSPSKETQDKVYFIALLIICLSSWYIYIIFGLPKRLNKQLLHRTSTN
ncbi:hypothetical protein [Pelosinus sp. IPA-1]|uniref:hypothetical protein n=1 Tax=Pelosinus sp. IPA-1 TaxID=3029569 RepID=UPI00243616CD|nr:hypothetical protein [Pelosinus sp. IPA-1]GMB00084.1 hypothetical protein PIPA1_28830 [Pelosinus sp. IPA-1]